MERGEDEEGRTGVGKGNERRTTTDWCASKFENGLVDYFIRERGDECRTDEPLSSSCRRNSNNHIRTDARMAVTILQTSRPQNLGDAILLVQKRFLVHFVQQTALPVPARDRMQIFQSLFPRPDITHLYHD